MPVPRSRQPGPLASWPWWRRALLAAALLGAVVVLERGLGGWWDAATAAALAGALIVAAVRGSEPARHLLVTIACAAAGFVLFVALLAAVS